MNDTQSLQKKDCLNLRIDGDSLKGSFVNTMKNNSHLELNKEYVVPGEEELIKKVAELLRSRLEKTYLTGTMYRDTHAKGHTLVRGEFTIEPALPEELRVGLFKEARSYPCWIRFANTSPTPSPDIKPDIRSMSLKLMGVEGRMLWQSEEDAKTLDIIMMGSEIFLAPDLQQFYDMEVAFDKGRISTAKFFLTHPRIALTIATRFQKCANVLEVPYGSETAYLFGDRAVQYRIRPHQAAVSTVPRHPTTNYLRERLIEHLAHADASFDFMVQFQTDPYKMPIENPMVAWPEALSPFRKVATIRLPSQNCDTPERAEFCEHISFNPWRTLPEHRPIGGINRARKEVYPVISEFRHRRNNVPQREPRAEDNF
jgi:hypothetical protein